MICWQNPKASKLCWPWKGTAFHYHVGLLGNRYNFAIFQSSELYGTRSLPRTFPASAALLMAVDLWQSPIESMKHWRQTTRLKSTCPNLLVCSAPAWGWEWSIYIYPSACIPLQNCICITIYYIIGSHAKSQFKFKTARVLAVRTVHLSISVVLALITVLVSSFGYYPNWGSEIQILLTHIHSGQLT